MPVLHAVGLLAVLLIRITLMQILILIRLFQFDMEPDPTFHYDGDLDLMFHFNADQNRAPHQSNENL